MNSLSDMVGSQDWICLVQCWHNRLRLIYCGVLLHNDLAPHIPCIHLVDSACCLFLNKSKIRKL